MTKSWWIAALISVGTTHSGVAQSGRSTADDSAAFQFAAVAAIKMLGPTIIDAAEHPPRAWTITVPTRTSGDRWDIFARHLRLMLRSRDPIPNDTFRGMIEIGAPQITADSLFTTLRIGGQSLCNGAWAGDATTYSVRVVRRSQSVADPTIRSIMESDSPGCP